MHTLCASIRCPDISVMAVFLNLAHFGTTEKLDGRKADLFKVTFS
jgi:hypothetical protein